MGGAGRRHRAGGSYGEIPDDYPPAEQPYQAKSSGASSLYPFSRSTFVAAVGNLYLLAASKPLREDRTPGGRGKEWDSPPPAAPPRPG